MSSWPMEVVTEVEIVEGRGMRIQRDPSSSAEVERQRMEGGDGASGGPLHIHRRQVERYIVETGMLLVRRGRDRIRLGAGRPGTCRI